MPENQIKPKLDKTLSANLFKSTILSAMLYASGMWADPCRKYCCMSISKGRNLRAEWSEESDSRVQKAEVMLGWMHCKIHRQQIDLYSYQVLSKRLDTANCKSSLMMGR